MNHIEAMKLALEALNQATGMCAERTSTRRDIDEAIAALRQAIQEAEKQEQWTPDDMAHRPGGLSMEDEPDLSEQGRNRSAVLGNNIQAMVDAGLPFLDALETTLKVYDHPTKPQEDTAYRPGGLSMEQKPVAWWNPDESAVSFKKLRGDWQPLYAAPVHAIDTLEKHVDETAKDGHEPDVYGDGNVYRGQRSKDSETKTLHLLREENAKLWGWVNELSQKRNPTTPPKREWQGLTDETIWLEYQRFWPFHPAEEPTLAKDIVKFARAIEAKLKAKNT